MAEKGLNSNGQTNLCSWLKSHWFIRSLLIFLPTIWFTVILKFFGKLIGLCNEDGQSLSTFGIVSTGIICLISFLLIIFSSYQDKKVSIHENNKIELEGTRSTLSLYVLLLNSIYNICTSKYDTLVTIMEAVQKQVTMPPIIVSDPLKQITCLVDELRTCICQMTKVEERNIAVAIAFEPELTKGEWEWFRNCRGIEGGKSVKELIENEKSTFNIVYSGKEDYVFENSKSLAQDNGRYITDKKDNSSPNGSIICKNITIGRRESYHFRVILTVSTYGKKLVGDDDATSIENVKRNIEESILYEFEKRLQIELVLLWLKNMNEAK